MKIKNILIIVLILIMIPVIYAYDEQFNVDENQYAVSDGDFQFQSDLNSNYIPPQAVSGGGSGEITLYPNQRSGVLLENNSITGEVFYDNKSIEKKVTNIYLWIYLLVAVVGLLILILLMKNKGSRGRRVSSDVYEE